MKKLVLSLATIAFVLFLVTCEKFDNGLLTDNLESNSKTTKGNQLQAMPTITSITPSQASRGDVITITGTNLLPATSKVCYFNDKPMTTLSWKKTAIKVSIYATSVGSGLKKVYVIVDGKKSNEVYFTVKTVPQTWDTKNLDVATYRNGDPIPQVTDPFLWQNLTSGAWCYYNNDPAMGAIYGKLYNWYAITDPRGLGPTGWHVPKYWWEGINLILNNGDFDVAGGPMKDATTTYWAYPNTGATNSSGFTALPGGYRNETGQFVGLGQEARFWFINDVYDWVFLLKYNTAEAQSGATYSKRGFSVRLIKD